jgi:2'-5' RNA ligase
VRGALKGIPAFDVRFDTLGGFPNERRARIAWAGSRSKDPRFARLADGVRESCRAFATLDEKPPVLHVTLGRLRDPMPLPAIRFDARTMRVDTVALFESLPGEKTTRYEIVDRFALTVQASSPAASR